MTFGTPTGTVDAHTRITPACGDVTNRGLDQAGTALAQGGVSCNHLIAVDPATSHLALALDEVGSGSARDLRVYLLDTSGAQIMTGVLDGLSNPIWHAAWLFTRNDRVWVCVEKKCAVIDATGTTTFAATPPGFYVDGVMAAPTGITVLGQGEGNLAQSIVAATLPCMTP